MPGQMEHDAGMQVGHYKFVIKGESANGVQNSGCLTKGSRSVQRMEAGVVRWLGDKDTKSDGDSGAHHSILLDDLQRKLLLGHKQLHHTQIE